MEQDKKLPEGVFSAMKKNGEVYYRSSITYKRRHISLGSYPTMKEAHEVYVTVRKALDTPCSLSDYPTDTVLPFEKWVSILNFKENGIYFQTPIFLRAKYFEYYLEKQKILKFDMDDLFYFSSHKIMCRGNHYFVAEYGMQTTILSRYGIKSYAVCDIDYTFVNGDPLDFRRENLLIQNTYHGVRAVTGKKGTVYKVRIHIHGYYHVGTYATITEAAIAYNKAIDILQKRGLHKNFLPNYIDGISPSAYADIYSKLRIADKIKEYTP